jgi:hypothetical protein
MSIDELVKRRTDKITEISRLDYLIRTTARRCQRRHSAWLALYFFVVASAGPCRLRAK